MAEPAAVLSILITANTKPAMAGLAKTQGQLVATSKTAAATGAVFKKAMLGASVAAVGAATALHKVGEAFDDAYDKIETRTGSTGKQLEKLKKSFRDTVTTVPTDFESASEAVAELNRRLDLTGKPLTKLSRQMTALAKVTGEDLGALLPAISRSFRDWEVSTRRQTRTLDGFFRLSQKTGASVTDLAESVVQFGAPLRNFGFTLEEAASMFATFEEAGVNMTTVMSGLRLATGNLAQPTDELKKRLKDLGLATKEPNQQFAGIIKAMGQARTEQEALSVAIDVFGKRAANDMKEAVKQGRFEMDKLAAVMRGADGDITKAERATRDFSEQWQLFKNRLAVVVEPVATRFFALMADGMKAINRLDLKGVISAINDFWQRAGFLRDVLGRVWAAIKQGFQGLVQFFRGAVKLISGVLTGDFGRAWRGVKDIFSSGVKAVISIVRAATAPFRAAASAIGDALGGAFGGAWEKIKDIFRGGRDVLIDIVNFIIDEVINRIPGVQLDLIGGGRGKGRESGTGKTVNATQNTPKRSIDKLFSGGKVTKPMAIVGEEAPTHPEFVLATNPAYRKRNLGLWEQAGKAMGVPGFAKGGIPTQGIAAGAVKSASSYIGDMSRAPFDRLPDFMAGTGEFIKDRFADFIRDKVKGLLDTATSAAAGAIGTVDVPEGNVGRQIAAAINMGKKFGLSVSSFLRPGDDGFHNPAYSPPHQAVDIAGSASAMLGFAKSAIKNFGVSNILELFHNPLGFQVDNYARGPMTVMDHYDHVHLAFKEGGIIGRPIPQALQPFNKVYPKHVSPDYSGYSMPADKVAMLAEFFGMPGVGMAAIANRESNYRPGAVGDDAAAGYGNTFGYGLWQITNKASGMDSFVNSQFGGYGNLLNPIANAIVAAKMFAARGFAPWGPSGGAPASSHWQGDMGQLTRAGASGGGKKGGRKGAGAGGLLDLSIDSIIPDKFPKLPKEDIARTVELIGRDEGRGRNAMGKLLGRFREIGLGPGISEKLAGAQGAAEIAADMADRASQLGGLVNGKDESGWLGDELAHRFELRNTLARAQKQLGEKIARVREFEDIARAVLDKVKEALAKAEARYRKLEGKLKDAQGALRSELKKPARDQDPKRIAALKDRIRHLASEMGVELWHIDANKARREALRGKIIPAITKKATGLGQDRGTYLGELTSVQGLGSTTDPLDALPAVGVLGGDIFRLQMRLHELGQNVNVTDSATTASSLDVAGLQRFAEAVQLGAFNRQSFAGLFATGGFIGAGQWGIAGETGLPEVVHGPARVYSPSESAAMLGGELTVVIEDGAVDPNKIRVIAGQEVDVKIRQNDRATRERYSAGAS